MYILKNVAEPNCVDSGGDVVTCDKTRQYSIPPVYVSWSEASTQCASLGAQLAKFDTQEAYDDLVEIVDLFFGLDYPYAWTSLHNPNGYSCSNAACTNQLRWDDNSPFVYQSYMVSSISGSSTANYLCNIFYSLDGKIWGRLCTYNYRPICTVQCKLN